MGSIYRENWKRASKKNIVAAIDDHDLVRVEDLAIATGILGVGGGGGASDLAASGFMTADDIAASGFITADDIAASGFVVGPNTATDNSIPLYDGADGKLIKTSPITYIGSALNVTGTVYASETLIAQQNLVVRPGGNVANGGTFSTTINLILSTTSSGNLPSGPGQGDIRIIKDADGVAGSTPITISGNGKTIDGDIEIQLVSNYESVTLLYNINKSEWHVI